MPLFKPFGQRSNPIPLRDERLVQQQQFVQRVHPGHMRAGIAHQLQAHYLQGQALDAASGRKGLGYVRSLANNSRMVSVMTTPGTACSAAARLSVSS